MPRLAPHVSTFALPIATLHAADCGDHPLHCGQLPSLPFHCTAQHLVVLAVLLQPTVAAICCGEFLDQWHLYKSGIMGDSVQVNKPWSDLIPAVSCSGCVYAGAA